MSRYLFKFIGGKYEGGQVELPDTGEVGLGRAQELGICLVEDMVSRHHAKIEMLPNQVVLTDLNSTNGTFVNGERVQKCEIEHDDRVLVGTSIMRLVDTHVAVSTAAPANLTPQESAAVPDAAQSPGVANAADDLEIQIDLDGDGDGSANTQVVAPTHAMSGDLTDVPLTDLLQLLSGNQRSGEVRLDGVGEATLNLHQGRLTDVRVTLRPELTALKALCRVLRWSNGSFAFSATPQSLTDAAADASHAPSPGRLTGRLEEVLMEATRQNDEAARLRDPLGGPELTLQVAQPLQGRLADQTPQALDIWQHVLQSPGLLDDLLDHRPEADGDALATILALRDAGLMQIIDP